MQTASGVMALAAIGAPVSASNQGPAAHADEALIEQAFSQLLSDFGAQGDGEPMQQFMRAQNWVSPNPGVLTAQGLEIADTPLATIDAGQILTPEDAQMLLGKLDTLIEQQGGEPAAALTALRDQLKGVVEKDAPVTVAQLIATTPQLQEVKSVAVVASLLQVLRKSPQKSENEEEVPSQKLSAMQQLPAMVFRADRGEASPEAPAETQEKKKGRSPLDMVTVVTPLSMQQTAVAQDRSADDAALSASGERYSLDDLVPAMKPVEAKKTQADDLPDVTLPSVPLAANQGNPVNSGVKADAGEGAKLAGDDRVATAIRSIDDAGASNAEPLLATHTASAPHSSAAHAPKFADLIPMQGVINHAPIKEQVHVAISKAASEGVEQITIQLDPVDLGRVEVKMNTNKEGHTQIYFMVDKPETFDGLSRDARYLERSLQEAGIKADTGSMQFNLRQQPQPQMQSDLNGQGQPQQQPSDTDGEPSHAASSMSAISPAILTRNYLFNIREGVDISA